MSSVSPITGIAHVGIRVHDLARARAFYEILGFEFIIGPVGPEPVAILKHPCGAELNLILNASDGSGTNVLMDIAEKHPGYTHLALAISDLSAMQANLGSAGIAISEGPVKFAESVTSIFIRDPDGNVIELNENKAEMGLAAQ